MTRKPRNLNPANALTLLRLVLVPVFAVALISGKDAVAFALFAAASLSDLVDGWLARRYGWVTPLGIFIDPLADKALQLTAFSLLARQDALPLWVAVVAWSRELIVVTGFVLLALVAEIRNVKSSLLGKGGTLAQMSALSLLLASQAWAGPPGSGAALRALLAGSVLLHFTGGLEYAWRGFQAYEAREAALAKGPEAPPSADKDPRT
jgi:CDP-diacylglycerol--glycerol-3-phosphate 3-phosphatidyltransferase